MAQKAARKGKVNVNVEKSSTNTIFTINIVFYISLFLLVALPPYFRGMYFDNEFLPTIGITSIVVVIWALIKIFKKEPIITERLDYAALSLVGAYFISTFFAVNIRTAIGETLKYVDYVFIYFMVSRLANDKKKIWVLLNVLVLSSFGVAVVGLLSAAGYINYNGSWVGGRINSTFQYANTAASFMMAFLFVNFALISYTENKYIKALYGIEAFVQFYAYIFTLSRGAWVMFPFLFLFLIIMMPKGKKVEPFIYLIGIVVASSLPIVKFNSIVNGPKPHNLLMWIFVGALLSAIFTYLISFIVDAVNKISLKVGISIIVIVGILSSIGGYMVLTSQMPLTLSHGQNEADSLKSVTRFVNADADRIYVLKYVVKSENSENKDWAYGITIDSRNDLDQPTKIKDVYDKESFSGEKTIEFSTLKDTKRLAITFINNFKGTSVTFEKAYIYPKNNPKDVQNIMLKYKYLPENVASRIQDISLSSHSSSERMQFYKDGFKIFKDYPLFGAGGGAWASLYFKYQSYLYWTTQTHNYFMQVLLDTGVVGAAAIIFFLIALILSIFKLYKTEMDRYERILLASAATGILSLYAHAAMDFDLSLSAVTIALYALIGIINSMSISRKESTTPIIKGKKLYNGYYNYGVLIVGIVVMFISFSLSAALRYAEKGDSLVKTNNIGQAMQYYKSAVSYDPWNAKYRMSYGQTLASIADQTKDAATLQEAMNEEQKAVDLEPFNSQLSAQLGAFYLAHGQIDKGIQYVKKAVEVQPLRPENYQQLADAYNKVGMFYLQNNDKVKAKEYLEKAVDVENLFNEANSKSEEPKPMTDTMKKIVENSKEALKGIQ
ncbi:O-antigen ligase family protein [Thermoanaerobacterium thermosaccharolyticum]|uniref:O-antigen ligase family protein n=1 Tax=Thermoanaerobacterium thermosaccharolyticum TaxID=1517 RepID=UPI003DA9537D